MQTQDMVVLRYRDGRTERALIANIDPARRLVEATRDEGNTEVPFSDLKAVFFPRLLPDVAPAGGSTIAVEFADGEVIRGLASNPPQPTGFSLYPLHSTKHDRIFVVTSAIVSIEVEKL
jgi:hypothetical protein